MTVHLCIAVITLCPVACVSEPACTLLHPLSHVGANVDVHRLLVCPYALLSLQGHGADWASLTMLCHRCPTAQTLCSANPHTCKTIIV